jgi:hypothetical protein
MAFSPTPLAVVPTESAWFGVEDGGHVVDLRDQDLYKVNDLHVMISEAEKTHYY